ncbi:MAG: hypothetical protein ACYCUV_11490 [Phycisphaerae bacterium]
MTRMIQALKRVNNRLPESLSGEFVDGLAHGVGWRWPKRSLSRSLCAVASELIPMTSA